MADDLNWRRCGTRLRDASICKNLDFQESPKYLPGIIWRFYINQRFSVAKNSVFPNFRKYLFGGNGEYQRLAVEKIWKSEKSVGLASGCRFVAHDPFVRRFAQEFSRLSDRTPSGEDEPSSDNEAEKLESPENVSLKQKNYRRNSRASATTQATKLNSVWPPPPHNGRSAPLSSFTATPLPPPLSTAARGRRQSPLAGVDRRPPSKARPLPANGRSSVAVQEGRA